MKVMTIDKKRDPFASWPIYLSPLPAYDPGGGAKVMKGLEA